jgi:hypothetical protein
MNEPFDLPAPASCRVERGARPAGSRRAFSFIRFPRIPHPSMVRSKPGRVRIFVAAIFDQIFVMASPYRH